MEFNDLKEVTKNALKWFEQNKCVGCSKSGSYSSPRISSEYPDCATPFSFDLYNMCSYGCLYCAPRGTKISTPEGFKNIESLNIGDEVLTFNFDTNKIEKDVVKQFMVKDSEELFEIVLYNGKKIQLTGNHPVYIKDRGWIKTKNISKDDEVIHYKSVTRSYEMTLKNPMKDKKVAKKQSNSLKTSYASGKLDNLKRRIGISSKERIIKYNKTEEQRNMVSLRMKTNNPMNKESNTKKVQETVKEQYENGRTPYWTNKKRDNSKIHSMLGKKGFLSSGQKLLYKTLKDFDINFIGNHEIENPFASKNYSIDAYLPDYRLGLEFDGFYTHFKKNIANKERKRDDYIKNNYDIKIIRISNKNQIKEVIKKIKGVSQ